MTDNYETILGFDCSSTTIGYSVLKIDKLNKNIIFESVNYIKPNKKDNLIKRLADTRDEVLKIINQVKPDIIAIEDLIQFMKGKSTAKTIITLTTFNRMICLVAYDYLKKYPELYNVMTIRHGLKLNKIFPKKEDMPELIASHLGIKFPYVYNKKGKMKEECLDMADSIAVGLYSAFVHTDKIKKKKKATK